MNHKVTNIWSKQDWKWIVCVMTSLTSLVITINESIFLMFFSQCISFVSRNNTYFFLSEQFHLLLIKRTKTNFTLDILYYINTWCSGLLCLSFESNILNHYRPRFFKILKQSQFMIFSLGNYKKQPISTRARRKKTFPKVTKWTGMSQYLLRGDLSNPLLGVDWDHTDLLTTKLFFPTYIFVGQKEQ